MQLQYKRSDIPNPIQVLRKSGYSQFIDPNTKKESFIIRLTPDFYPRFHLYLEGDDEIVSFNLHLDQKKPSYKGTNMHGGEYDGPRVEKEMDRIRRWAKAIYPQAEEIQRGTKVIEDLEVVEDVEVVKVDTVPKQESVTEQKPQDDTPGDLFRGIFLSE